MGQTCRQIQNLGETLTLFFVCASEFPIALCVLGDQDELPLCLQPHLWEAKSGGSPSSKAPNPSDFASAHHGSRLCQSVASN